MKKVRLDMADAAAAGAGGAFGQELGAQLPMPAPAYSATTAPTSRSSRRWLALAGRVVRNAVIAVALMALVPVGLVAVRGDQLAWMLYRANAYTTDRVAVTEPVRSFRLPADPSITAMQAGLALNALQSRAKPSGFRMIEPASRPAASWRTEALTPDMFPSRRPSVWDGPSTQTVLEAAAKGLTPRELDYLRRLAQSPVWREYDVVVRAPAVDIIGGSLAIPFGPNASVEYLPTMRYKELRGLAFAAVSRAAWFMANGQRDSAETVLRSIISYGFVFIDNGSSKMDELIGAVIVGTGRDALQRFYLIEHDPRATAAGLVMPRASRATSSDAAPVSIEDVRRQALARVEDPSLPLGERFHTARALSLASCTNPRELLFGPRSDVTDVLARARHSLARYPSEQALLGLQSQVFTDPSAFRASGPLQSLTVSAATIVGTVLHNPRLASCTILLSGK